jgi:D-alanine-D-alanine ligase
METLRVAVIMGGTSSERDVSLRSGANVAQALDRTRYVVTPVDFTGDPAQLLALRGAVDVAVLALHGPVGEDGRIQALLELLGIPYTGSGVLASAVAMHKGVARALYRDAGIPIPPGLELDLAAMSREDAAARVRAEVGVPCVVKPANEGSTIGISIVRDDAALPAALATAAGYDTALVVERFVVGTEISVPVLGVPARALPAVEVVPCSGFYDYERKYTPGATEEYCPARISDAAAAEAARLAERAHTALGCRSVSRTDMIVADDGLYVLETNTLPGMTDTSLLPLSARVAGMSFSALLDRLIADARPA